MKRYIEVTCCMSCRQVIRQILESGLACFQESYQPVLRGEGLPHEQHLSYHLDSPKKDTQ